MCNSYNKSIININELFMNYYCSNYDNEYKLYDLSEFTSKPKWCLIQDDKYGEPKLLKVIDFYEGAVDTIEYAIRLRDDLIKQIPLSKV